MRLLSVVGRLMGASQFPLFEDIDEISFYSRVFALNSVDLCIKSTLFAIVKCKITLFT